MMMSGLVVARGSAAGTEFSIHERAIALTFQARQQLISPALNVRQQPTIRIERITTPLACLPQGGGQPVGRVLRGFVGDLVRDADGIVLVDGIGRTPQVMQEAVDGTLDLSAELLRQAGGCKNFCV